MASKDYSGPAYSTGYENYCIRSVLLPSHDSTGTAMELDVRVEYVVDDIFQGAGVVSGIYSCVQCAAA